MRAQRLLRHPALVVAAGLVLASCVGEDLDAAGERVPVPPELQGRWITPDEPYRDRFVEITAERLTFGTGGDSSTTERIVALFARDGARGTLYQFRYRGPGTVIYDFDILYDPAQETFQMENREDVTWTRAREGS